MVDGRRTKPVLVLSLMPAERGARRLALAIVLLSLAVFVALAPFARVRLAPLAAFIPGYEAALAISDLLTAALLFGQFSIARSRALLVLACGYLFTMLTTVAHALTFPGLFSETGLLGAGPQSTAWLYMFWHSGFPIAVAGYTLLRDRDAVPMRGAASAAILSSTAAVVAIVVALTALATTGEALLPAVMQAGHYAPAQLLIVAVVWSLSLLALVLLARRRPYAVLDLWLMAALCAWLCDIALSALLNAQRFDLGFYAGRIYGLAAASFVLIVLLLETIALYARLARAMELERQERDRRLHELRSELIHVSRVSELGQMVSALVHEVNQPLTAIGNYLRAGQRLIHTGNTAHLETALGKAADEATRAGAIIKRLRDFIRKKESTRRAEDLGPVLEETVALALVGRDRHAVDVTVRVDPAASAVMVDKIQIQQVLLNLIRNALEAMRDVVPPTLVIAAAPAGAEMIELSVADSGPGLSETVRERLFQPFVTTKSEGMGVGLSICHAIIEAHGGRIRAEDNPGGGTVFRFTVPEAGMVAQAAD